MNTTATSVTFTKSLLSWQLWCLFFVYLCVVFFAWGVVALSVWARKWNILNSNQICGQKMESVLITLEVPVHPHNTAEVPLIKILKLCDELVTPGVYPAFTNVSWEALAPLSCVPARENLKKKKKNHIIYACIMRYQWPHTISYFTIHTKTLLKENKMWSCVSFVKLILAPILFIFWKFLFSCKAIQFDFLSAWSLSQWKMQRRLPTYSVQWNK